MSGHWFRAYDRMVDDEKLRLLAFEDRWHFVAICCLASAGLMDEPDSDLKWRKVAVKLGVQRAELDEIARRLREVGLVDESMRPIKFDDLQFKSDNSTERVRKYREKSTTKRDETLQKQPRNVSVTPQDTETDSETDISPPNGGVSAGADLPTQMMDAYNEVAGGLGLPKCVKMNAARRKSARARLKEIGGMDAWKAALAKVAVSPFLLGENDREWRCDIDFLLQPSSLLRVIEGKYDPPGMSGAGPPDDGLTPAERYRRSANAQTPPQ